LRKDADRLPAQGKTTRPARALVAWIGRGQIPEYGPQHSWFAARESKTAADAGALGGDLIKGKATPRR